MADKKISEMSSALASAGADILPIVQGGTNKKVTIANLFGKINTPVVINEAMADMDTQIRGDTDTNLVFVDASTDRVGFGTATPAEKVDINGNLKLNGFIRNTSVDTQTSSGVVSLITESTVLAASSAAAVTLADGADGQVKVLVANNVGPVTLTTSHPAGFASIGFNASGETATLKFVDGKWYILSVNGATIA